MGIGEVLLIAVALSIDAFAVGMTNGMQEPKMRFLKMLLIAGMYGFFQFLMPVVGYFSSSVFSALVEKIAPWLSFALLGAIGGKMIFDGVMEMTSRQVQTVGGIPLKEILQKSGLTMGTLLAQAIATSIDALAVGIAFLAVGTTEGLPFHAALCALIIGAVTLILSLGAVELGKRAGDKFSDKAGFAGGCVLVAIGLKILLEAVM